MLVSKFGRLQSQTSHQFKHWFTASAYKAGILLLSNPIQGGNNEST